MKGNGAPPPRAQMERINERRNIEQGEHFSAWSNAATRRAQLVLISHAAVPCFLPPRIISGKRRQPKASCRGFFAALTPLRFLPPLAPPSLPLIFAFAQQRGGCVSRWEAQQGEDKRRWRLTRIIWHGSQGAHATSATIFRFAWFWRK